MKYLHPIGKCQIRCDDSTHSLVSRGKQLKKQLSRCEIKCNIPKLIDYEKIYFSKLLIVL